MFDTRAPGEVTRTTRLKVWVEYPAASHLDESSGKALSAKHAYQAELKNLTVWAHFSFEVVGESPEAKVCSRSKRTLGSYHETHKGTGLEPLGSQPRSGQNPESVREYLHEMLVPHEHSYKHNNIYTTMEWKNLEANRAQRPSRKLESW